MIRIFRSTAFVIAACMALAGLQGCASVVQPSEKPPNAVEMSGVISGLSAPSYQGLSSAQQSSAALAGGYAGVLLANAIDARQGNRDVSSIVVTVSNTLSLTLPVTGTFQPGECVKLFVDPLFRELLNRKDVANMSMPTGSVFIQKSAC
jgi:hypothetical protein